MATNHPHPRLRLIASWQHNIKTALFDATPLMIPPTSACGLIVHLSSRLRVAFLTRAQCGVIDALQCSATLTLVMQHARGVCRCKPPSKAWLGE